MKRFVVLPVAATVIAAAAVSPASAGMLAEGQQGKEWKTVFNGYGTVFEKNNGSVVLEPKAPENSSDTHAALAVNTKAKYGKKGFKTRIAVKNVKQTRTPVGNAWESAWIVWDYIDNDHFYYLAVKPNGWELGKRDPAYPGGQRFLATGENFTFPFDGKRKVFTIFDTGKTMIVKHKKATLTKFTDNERPYRKGKIAAYTEDAKAEFDVVSFKSR